MILWPIVRKKWETCGKYLRIPENPGKNFQLKTGHRQLCMLGCTDSLVFQRTAIYCRCCLASRPSSLVLILLKARKRGTSDLKLCKSAVSAGHSGIPAINKCIGPI